MPSRVKATNRDARPTTWSPPKQVPPVTLLERTDFFPIKGRKILYIEDNDNIRLSLRDHHAALHYESLAAKLAGVASAVVPWTVITASGETQHRVAFFRRFGFEVLTIPRETVRTATGVTLKGNADMDIAFHVGYLAASKQLDILIASGDGDLCLAIARGIKRLPKPRAVFTLSVPGATSHRILMQNNPSLFDGNIHIGRDLTRPQF
jgi:hypothetical protein